LLCEKLERKCKMTELTNTMTKQELIATQNVNNMENGSLISQIADKVYPIGSIYMSVKSTSPAQLFGGTWEQIQGRFLLASDDNYTIGSTGGEPTHRLTVNEIPAHNHEILSGYVLAGGTNLNYDVFNYSRTNINDPGFKPADYFMSKTGGGQPHNNMPPYLVVNIWKRIA